MSGRFASRNDGQASIRPRRDDGENVDAIKARTDAMPMLQLGPVVMTGKTLRLNATTPQFFVLQLGPVVMTGKTPHRRHPVRPR